MRILRYLWFHLIMLATGWWPDLVPAMQVRGFLLRPAFKTCGENFQIASRVTINFPNRLEIGRNVYIAAGCWLHARGGMSIEDEVQIGPYSVLVTGDHSRREGSYRYGRSLMAPIRLRYGCWVAAHTTVAKGVTIGRGALLAANSVANRDIPDYAIAGGVPARVIADNRSKIEIAAYPAKTWS